MKHTSQKLFFLLLSCVFIISSVTTAFAVSTDKEKETKARITGSDVYFRAAATSHSNILDVLDKDTEVIVLSTSNSDWYKVSVNSETGYVSSKFIEIKQTIDKTEKTDEKKAESNSGTVTGSDVRMRSNPSTSGSIVKTLNRFDKVEILDTNVKGWYKIKSGDDVGFVSSMYVNLSSEDTTSTTAATTDTLPVSSTSVKAVGIVNGSAVRVRSSASTSGTILTSLNKNSVVSVVGSINDWFKISYEGKEGYIFSNYLDISSNSKELKSYGKVNASALNVRSKPSSSSAKAFELSKNVFVDVTGFDNGWFYISYDGKEGYVSGDYLDLCFSKNSPVNNTTANINTSSAAASIADVVFSNNYSAAGSDLVSMALQYLGTPYVYGGASPSGFDCSGFTMYVYKQFGYSLPHGATPQLNYGYSVSKSELSPGDLVFFNDSSISSSAASHVGIYIGNGEFVHASSSSGNSRCVCISSLSSSYYANHYLGARHIVN